MIGELAVFLTNWSISWRLLTLARDEGDELAHALLHALFCLFRDLCVLGERRLHDARDWSKVANVSV